MLGVSTATLKDWRASSKGPDYLKLGDAQNASVRYREEDVHSFVAARMEPVQEEGTT